MNSQQAVTANTRIESDEAYDFENAAVIQQASQLLYRAKGYRRGSTVDS